MIPAIVFNLNYQKYYPENYKAKDENEQKRITKSNKFYRCHSDYNIVTYSNDHGVDNIPLDTIEEMESILDDKGNLKIIDKNYIDYMQNRGGSTGLFDKDGSIDKSQFKEYQEKLRTTHSTIWNGILSFTPEYSDIYCRNKKEAYNTIKNTIDNFFLEAGLTPENMEWFSAYHTNTDNRHIHIIFFEKEPLELNSKGQPKWHNYKLPKNVICNYKYKIANYHHAVDYGYFALRDTARMELKTYLNKSENQDYIINLSKDLGLLTSKQYARQTNETKSKLKNALEQLIEMDSSHEETNLETGEVLIKPGLKEITDRYFKSLHKTQLQIINNYNEVNVKMSDNAKKFESNRITEYYNRMCNELLKCIFEFRQTEKNLSDDKNFTKDLESALNDLKGIDLKTDFKTNEEAYKSICYKGYKHNKKKIELKKELILARFESKEEKIKAYNKAYDVINPKEYPSMEKDRLILNQYGINYIVNNTNEIAFKSDTKSGVIKGDYNQYTFINAKGDYETFNLNLNPSIQVKGITSIFHKLGLNDNKIINLCDSLDQNGLLFNLITKTGIYDLDEIGNRAIAGKKIYSKNNNPEAIRKQANIYESNNQKASRLFGSLLTTIAGEQNDMLEELARFEKYWQEKHSKDELLNEKGEPEELDSLLTKKKKKKSLMELS